MDQKPNLSFALPIGSESRWSDMLATLIATDPAPAVLLFGLGVNPPDVVVHREVAVDSKNRPDLVLSVGGRRVAVIEVKVLSGLGEKQLDRYRTAVPGAEHYVLIYPWRLPVHVASDAGWDSVSWENLLDSYSRSYHAWVSATARAWLAHLHNALPRVGSQTVWNGLQDGEDFVLSLRVRVSWLYSQIKPPRPVEHDLIMSSAGVSWVVRMYASTGRPGYWIMSELEERLDVRDYPKSAGPSVHQPLGPSAKVCLYRYGTNTSAGFDWDHLLRLWPQMQHAAFEWVTNPAQPKAAHDKEGINRIRNLGAPRFLGIGFGDAEAKARKACMFGARIQYPPTIALGDLAVQLDQLAVLTRDLAVVEHRASPGDQAVEPAPFDTGDASDPGRALRRVAGGTAS